MSSRVSSPQFVGRSEQLSVLAEAFDLANSGRTTTVLLGGDAGVGKTRLVDEFARKARSAGALVATGVCVPTDSGGLPYAPIVGIVRDVASQLDQSAASEIVGPAAHGLGIDISGEEAPVDEFAKTRLFESVLAFVTKLARSSPVVFVFEDLHWADSASAELLGYLVRNLTETTALLVATYRSEEVVRDHPLHGWLTEMGRHPRVTQLPVSGLGRAETAVLLGNILGEQPSWALLDGVWARSQGNPFFAEELTAARDDASLSPELQGVILSRVRSLPKETQQALRMVAAAGPTVTHRLVAALGVPDADVLDLALAEAVDRQILVVDVNAAGYRFRHALLREAVYVSMLPGEASRLHRALAVALTTDPSLGASGPGHRAAELAGHWWAAGAWPQALDTSLAAADAAEAVWAFPEALAHLEHALTAIDRIPNPAIPAATGGSSRAQLLAKMSEVAYLAGAGQRALELAQAAIDLSDADADPFGVAHYYTLLGRRQFAVGDSQAAFDAYRVAVSLLPTDPPSVELARILAAEARGLMLVSRNSDGEARAREAIAVAVAVGAHDVEGHAARTLGVCRAALGYRDEGVALLRTAVAIAVEVRNPEDLDRAYVGLAHVHSDWGEHHEAAAMIVESRAVGERFGFPSLTGVAENSAWSLIRLGRYDEASALLVETGPAAIGIYNLATQLAPAQIAIRRGDFDEADRLLAGAAQSTIHLIDVQTRGQLYIEAAELALERGLPDAAYAEIERALALVATTDDASRRAQICALGVRALADQLVAAHVHARQFDADAARERAAHLVQEANQPVEPGARWRPPQAAWFATCMAEQSRLSQSSASLWAEAVSRCDTSLEVYPATYGRWRQAETLLENRAGRREAADCLQEAWSTATRIGAIPLRTRIEQLAQRARIPLRDIDIDLTEPAASAGSAVAGFGLTRREVEILTQLAEGMTDREIAEALFISKKTVSVHVSNVLRKLDVTNRVEAGRVGQVHGLGSPAPRNTSRARSEPVRPIRYRGQG